MKGKCELDAHDDETRDLAVVGAFVCLAVEMHRIAGCGVLPDDEVHSKVNGVILASLTTPVSEMLQAWQASEEFQALALDEMLGKFIPMVKAHYAIKRATAGARAPEGV